MWRPQPRRPHLHVIHTGGIFSRRRSQFFLLGDGLALLSHHVIQQAREQRMSIEITDSGDARGKVLCLGLVLG
jgi:hypothetical protein